METISRLQTNPFHSFAGVALALGAMQPAVIKLMTDLMVAVAAIEIAEVAEMFSRLRR